MSFLYPSFLWALTLLSIPIIIHFLNFQRTKTLYFSRVNFLEKVQERTSSRRKIRQWLILLARLLLVTCLVFAFAQPFIPNNNANGNDESKTVVIYIDNSPSMQNVDGMENIDRAIISAESIIKSYSNNVLFNIITNDFEIDSRLPLSQNNAFSYLASITLSEKTKSLESIINRKNLLVNDLDAPYDFYIISDFQQNFVNKTQSLNQDSSCTLFLTPVQGNSVNNITVDSVWIEEGFISNNEPLLLHAIIKKYGDANDSEGAVKLIVDSVEVSSSYFALKNNTTQKLDFTFSLPEKSSIQGKLTLNDEPINFDNDFYFQIEGMRPVDILYISSNNTRSSYIRTVYKNKDYFNLTERVSGELDLTQEIENSDLVLLQLDDNVLNEGLAQSLVYFYNKGGSIVIFLPDKEIAEIDRSLVSSLGLKIPSYKKDTLLRSISLSASDSPLFKGVFKNIPKNINNPKHKTPWKFSSTNESIFIANNLPVITTKSEGRQRAYLFGLPLNARQGEFYEHAYFVSLMYRIAFVSLHINEQIAYGNSQTLINVPYVGNRKDNVLKLENNTVSIIPEQERRLNSTLLNISGSALSSGFYNVKDEDSVILSFALNTPSTESDLTYITTTQLNELINQSENTSILSEEDVVGLKSDLRLNRVGLPLWRLFLILAIVFFIVETVLLRVLQQ